MTFHSYDQCEASPSRFLSSFHMRIVDGSWDFNEKCCMVVAWWDQHGDLPIVLTECERKDRFEHKEKNQTAVIQLGQEKV